MTPDITSDETFERSLGRLLAAAASNGVDPTGNWEIRNGDSFPDWETHIIELAKPE